MSPPLLKTTGSSKYFRKTLLQRSRDLVDYDVGAYPGLILTVHLKRHLTYYMLQLYCPSFLFVFLALVTMYFPTNASGIAAQYNIHFTNLITMTTMSNGIHAIIPKTSYLTFVDVWLQGCFVFLFICIAELVIFCAFNFSGRRLSGKTANLINEQSRRILPLLFLVFVIIYWLLATNTI